MGAAQRPFDWELHCVLGLGTADGSTIATAL
jgi:hypothetical protein